MEEDEEKPSDSADYHGGIVQTECCSDLEDTMKFEKISYGVMKNIIKIGITVGIAFVIFALCKHAYVTGEKVFSDKGVEAAPGNSVTVTIPDGATVSSVATLLEGYGLIEDKSMFKLQAKLYEIKDEPSDLYEYFRPGEYTLNTSYSAEMLINILTSGPGSEEAIANGETYVQPETTKKK